ncbi:MAG: DUF4493 domain-containing protein, partial [Rikenellaceae bacterium]
MKKNIVLLLMLLIGAVSCKSEDREYDSDGQIVVKGMLSFAKMNLQLNPEFGATAPASSSTKGVLPAPSLDEFMVNVVNTNDNSVVYTWKYRDMPQSISLKIGNYRLEACYPEKVQDGVWECPYFYGSIAFVIKNGQTTVIDDLVCRFSNVRVTVNYKPVFTEQMKSYSVTVSSPTATQNFTSSETRALYFNPASLIITVKGTMIDKNKLFTQSKILDVKAGDNIIFAVDYTLTGSGVPSIKVDATTNDRVVNLVVVDDDVIIDPNPDPDPEPEDPDKPKVPIIAGDGFDISQTMRHKFGESRVVDVKVTAEEGGIQMLKVIIESPTLEPILDAQDIPSTFDLANLSASDKRLFEEIGLIKAGEVIKGKTEYTFSVGAFFKL